MKIAPDKWKHFFVGIAMGVVLQTFFSSALNLRPGFSILCTFVSSAIIAYGFELHSKFTGKGHYEIMDAVAGVIGASVGIGVLLCLSLF